MIRLSFLKNSLSSPWRSVTLAGSVMLSTAAHGNITELAPLQSPSRLPVNFVAARRSGVVLLNYGRKDSRATESPVLQGGVVYSKDTATLRKPQTERGRALAVYREARGGLQRKDVKDAISSGGITLRQAVIISQIKPNGAPNVPRSWDSQREFLSLLLKDEERKGKKLSDPYIPHNHKSCNQAWYLRYSFSFRRSSIVALSSRISRLSSKRSLNRAVVPLFSRSSFSLWETILDMSAREYSRTSSAPVSSIYPAPFRGGSKSSHDGIRHAPGQQLGPLRGLGILGSLLLTRGSYPPRERTGDRP